MQAPISNSEGVRRALHFPSQPTYPPRNKVYEVKEPVAPYAVNYEPPSYKANYYGSSFSNICTNVLQYSVPNKPTNSYNAGAVSLINRNERESRVSRNAPFAPRIHDNSSVFDYAYPSSSGAIRVDIPPYSSLHDPYLHDFFAKKFRRQPVRPLSPASSTIKITRPNKSNKGNVLYKVTIVTGNKKNAGTNAKVFIKLKGTKGKLPRKRLSKKLKSHPRKKFKFEKGSTNIFKVKGQNIGDLTSVIIEHEGITKEESWYLEQIEIMNTSNGKCWTFICKNWLSLFEGDGKLTRELMAMPCAGRGKTEYEIVTVTGNVLNAGTNANVYVTLFGKYGISQKMRLKNVNPDCFERNKSDVFVVKCNCVGPLVKLRIEHDNTGIGAGWFLERVVVTDLRTKKWKYYFPCGKWLAKDEGDHRICRDLLGSLDPSKIIAGQKYKITVFTGNKSGAGTSAKVFATLFGELGDSGEMRLGNSFKSGSKNESVIECPNLGEIKHLRVCHDNSGLGPGWFLEKIIVDDIKQDRTYTFPCNRWLATNEDDGQISRDLLVNVGAVSNLPGVTYQLKVVTGDVTNAGTSARVYIVLYGGKKNEESSGVIWLDNGKFSRGRTDVLEFDIGVDLSPISKIDIGHDDSGPGAGWFLNKVMIFAPSTGIEQWFLCDKWLATDEDEGIIERTLYENSAMRKQRDKRNTWVVNVTTSNMAGAGTDANVYMVLYGKDKNGDYKKSDDIFLDNKSNNFEAGDIDSIKIHSADVGIPYKLRIWHDNANPAAGWHLDKVDLISPTGKIYTFNCGRWLATDEDDKEIIRELPAEGEHIRKPQILKQYRVIVVTAKKRGAGTDANVYLNIYGEQGDTGNRFLKYSKTNRNKFESGQTDEFIVEAVDLKKIKKIKLGHDGKNPGAGWFVDSVIIEDSTNSKYKEVFNINRWFAIDEDDGLIEREIFSGGASSLITTTYIVSVKTGNKSGAGTDANVHLKLFGEKSDSEEMKLRYSDNTRNKFEKGRTDVFKLEMSDIGIIKMIRIGHDAANPGSGWFLDEISIEIPSRGELYRFSSHRWLDKSEGDGLIEIELTPTDFITREIKIPHEVKVWTGDKMGAGTDANVFIQMYGEYGKTEEITLRNKTDNFETNQLDTFKIFAEDVGPLLKLRVGHDNSGRGPGWYLDKLCITKLVSPYDRKRKLTRKPSVKKIGRCEGPEDDIDSEEDFEKEKRRMEKQRKMSIKYREKNEENAKMEEFWFVCQKWFAKDEDDKKIVRTLLPTTADGKPIKGGLRELEYKIFVKTGDVSGAGTDANVFLCLTGELGDSGELFLDRSQNMNKFENDQEDIFSFTIPDLGRLAKVKVRHDNKGIGAAWFLAHIEVEDTKRKERVYFPCQNWLSKKEGDGLICRELIPVDVRYKDQITKDRTLDAIAVERAAETSEYDVSVFTNNKWGAGTDANVYIYLFGKDGDIGPIQLSNSLTFDNKFERGQEDKFKLEACGLGPLQKIRIGHDDSLPRSDWLLDKIEIYCSKEGKRYTFPCGKWLAKGREDGKLERDLFPFEEATEITEKCIPYQIKVFTSDKIGAGTDADVFVKLYGKDSCTKKESLCLDKRERKKKFKSGAVEEFVVRLEDVGEIEKLQIGHDNAGYGAAWHLNKVEIRKLVASGRDEKLLPGSDTYIFHCDKWFDKSKGDNAVVRDLVATEILKERRKKTGEVEKTKKKRKDTLIEKSYTVDVYTGNKDRAGTNANVFLTIFGDKGDTGERKLASSQHFDKFEKNQTDTFKINCADLGKLFKVKIRHDDSGFSSDWYLDKIEINDNVDNEKYMFYCERWLSKSKGDNKLSRSIYEKNYKGDMTSTPSMISSRAGISGSVNSLESEGFDPFARKSPRSRRQSELGKIAEHPVAYTVKVKTGTGYDNGTDSNVWINIFGSKLETGKQFLELPENKKGFEPGSIESFTFEAEDVKKIKAIEIGHDGVSTSKSWYLQDVVIDMPTKGKNYNFECKQWLGIDKGDGKVSRKFTLDNDAKSVISYQAKVFYELTLITADESGSGTDCQVSVQVFGKKGTTDLININKSGERFERDRQDEIQLEVDDVAPITKLRVQVDGKGERNEWLLKEARLLVPATGDKYNFKCNEWLGRGPNSKGKLSIDMVAILRGKTQLKTTDYTIKIRTSDIRHAGTSANVTIEIFGDKGDSGKIPLTNSRTNKKAFQRNQTDEFILQDVYSYGNLYKVRIQHDNAGIGSGWHLNYIDIADSADRFEYKFHCNKWLSKSDDDKQIIRELPCANPKTPEVPSSSKKGKCSYEIEITTSDKENAGMIHNCWLIVVGDKSESDVIKVVNEKKKDFKRGQSMTLKHRIKHLGSLKRIRMGAYARDEDRFKDSSENRSNEWHCKSVVITEIESGNKYTFNCKSWIRITKRLSVKYGNDFSLKDKEENEAITTKIANLDNVKYDIHVFTGSEPKSGTDSNVSITVFGKNGDSGVRKLTKPFTNLFEKDQKDTFTIECVDLGELTKIKIEHDSSSWFKKDWFLDRVEIFKQATGNKTTFPCGQWLSKSKGDRQTFRELLPRD